MYSICTQNLSSLQNVSSNESSDFFFLFFFFFLIDKIFEMFVKLNRKVQKNKYIL